MVRLKVSIFDFFLVSLLFQFLYGAIKRVEGSEKYINLKNFNSFMVRLKAFMASSTLQSL